MMKLLHVEVVRIFENLVEMSIIVRGPQNKTIAFSSGQNIKPVTLVKYAFFQLLLNCLNLGKEENLPSFIVDVEKI
jgi:hypothetical protein